MTSITSTSVEFNAVTCKPSISSPMDDLYDPATVESFWDDCWTNSALYGPRPQSQVNSTDNNKFVMVIPPPNVTGTLHLGHALTCSIEDTLTRWHRMHQDQTLWVPGTDHAGIATQAVVEKQLMRDYGLRRADLTRDKFLEHVWRWKERSGTRINDQIRRLGASVDWSRERFTMDEKCSKAVQTAFIRLYEQGYIYRADKLVNWSCALKTAISQIEVDYMDLVGPTELTVPNHPHKCLFGVLHSFAYPVELSSLDSSAAELEQQYLIVSTTRIETMLGDVAVAVHPDDPRYKPYHGRYLRHPLIKNRRLPIICDATLVDPQYGTGAVKITPAHDLKDYECAKRHDLPMINILNDDGTLNEMAGPFQYIQRYVVRDQVIEKLKEMGLYHGYVSNPMILGICSRTGDVIEPMLRPQWWMNCDRLAQRAVESVEFGHLHLIPAEYNAVWYNWLKNIQHWCISRQLWWGHRIPAFHVSINGQSQSDSSQYWIVADDACQALAKAQQEFGSLGTVTIDQDEDVLDTWFSSALFPFSVFGWPDESNADFRQFYPTTLLETGHDILFFWVARMVMMGLALTNQLPFHQVLLHPMIRDKFGRKMSKSLGNIIDPLDVIHGVSLSTLNEQIMTSHLPEDEKKRAIQAQCADYPNGIPACGADALRFCLLAYTVQSHDINLDIQRIIGYRHFANKLWQAHRLAFRFLGSMKDNLLYSNKDNIISTNNHNLANRWIFHQLFVCMSQIDRAMKEFNFSQATRACYEFWYDSFCGTYLELIKPIINGARQTDALENRSSIVSDSQQLTARSMYVCIDVALRLLHPFMPFLTEELYQRLSLYARDLEGNQRDHSSIMVARYPLPADHILWNDLKADETMSIIQSIARASRSIRTTHGLTSIKPNLTVQCSSVINGDLQPYTTYIATLGRLQNIDFQSDVDAYSASSNVNDQQGAPHAAQFPLSIFRVSLSSSLHLAFSWISESNQSWTRQFALLYQMDQDLWDVEDQITRLNVNMDKESFQRTNSAIQAKLSGKMSSLVQSRQSKLKEIDRNLQLLNDAQRLTYIQYRSNRMQEEVNKIQRQMEEAETQLRNLENNSTSIKKLVSRKNRLSDRKRQIDMLVKPDQ